ncbi:MAG TPA: hypothetical protein VGE29_15525 [Prosthecobacter sp.]
MLISFLLAQAQAPGKKPMPLPHDELPEVIIPPVPVPLWIYITGAVVLVGLLTLVLSLLLRPKAGRPVPPKRPWKEAMAAMKDLSARARGQAPAAVASQVSDILRRYFLHRYRIPAPFRTSKELFEGQQVKGASPKVLRYAPLAALWDELSFAPAPGNDEEVMELLARAMTLLEEDHPALGEALDVSLEEQAAKARAAAQSGGPFILRGICYVLALVHLIVSVGAVSLLFYYQEARDLFWGVMLVTAATAWCGLRLLKLTTVTDPALLPLDDLQGQSLEEKMQKLWGALAVLPVVLAALAAWVIYELRKLASGEVNSVTLWAPVSMMYELFGLWGGLAFIPLLCLFFVTHILSRLYVFGLHLKQPQARPVA